MYVETKMKFYFILITLILFLTGCDRLEEREGYVKHDDCRETIFTKEGELDTILKPFTCSYKKTNKGIIYGGQCLHVELDSNGRCTKVLIYQKEPPNICGKDFPVLHGDDLCYKY